MRFEVPAEISIYSAIKAVLWFAENYPADRLSLEQAEELREAANIMANRILEVKVNELHQALKK